MHQFAKGSLIFDLRASRSKNTIKPLFLHDCMDAKPFPGQPEEGFMGFITNEAQADFYVGNTIKSQILQDIIFKSRLPLSF